MVAYEFLRFDAVDVAIDAERVGQMPKSARVTLDAILQGGPLSVPQLRNATSLPSRTLRFALRCLSDAQLVDSRRNLKDARTVAYFIHPSRVRPAALEAARMRATDASAHGHLIESFSPSPGLSHGHARMA